MCTQNPHLKDSRQHPAQDRACCTHTEGHPRFPDLRPIRAPFPVPGRIGNGGKLADSRFRPNRETGIPSPFPCQIGNRGNGNWGFPGLATTTRLQTHWQEVRTQAWLRS